MQKRTRRLVWLLALTVWLTINLPNWFHSHWVNILPVSNGYLLAQAPQGQPIVSPGSTPFSAVGTGGTINLTQSGVRWHQFSWYSQGNITQCGMIVQTATGSGGTNVWQQFSPSAGPYDCSKQYGAVYVADSKVNLLRMTVPTFVCAAGGTCSTTLMYRGYSDDPTRVGNTATTSVVSLTSQGTTQIVAAQTDKIAVTFGAFTVTAGTTGQTIAFAQGTGTNCGTGLTPLTGNLVVLAGNTSAVPTMLSVGNGSAVIVIQTTSGQALCLQTGTVNPVNGWVTWVPTP